MKITLVGRRGNVIDHGQSLITMLQSSKVPALPKGIPTPAQISTPYAVSISSKPWKKVAQTITDPQDALIIEGFPQFDMQTKTIAVFATSVTTKKLQMEKRQPKEACA
jgi:hypothetical protein